MGSNGPNDPDGGPSGAPGRGPNTGLDGGRGRGRRPDLRPVPGAGAALDPHVRWLRTRIQRTLARSTAVAWLVAAVVATAGLHRLGAARWAVAVPGGLALGLGVVVVAVARAALTNPFSVGWLRARRRANRRLQLGPVDPLAPPLGRSAAVTAAVWDRSEPPRPVVDLYHASGRVLVARHRGEGWLSVLTRLDDGRILVTDTAAPVPHSRLVVNLVLDGDLDALLGRHGEVAAALGSSGAPGERADPALYLELRAVEEAALAQLGPRLAPFANPFPPARQLRLLGPLPPAELLHLAGVAAVGATGATPATGRQRPGGYR